LHEKKQSIVCRRPTLTGEETATAVLIIIIKDFRVKETAMGNKILSSQPRQIFVTLAICKLSDHATELQYNNYRYRVIILSDTYRLLLPNANPSRVWAGQAGATVRSVTDLTGMTKETSQNNVLNNNNNNNIMELIIIDTEVRTNKPDIIIKSTKEKLTDVAILANKIAAQK